MLLCAPVNYHQPTASTTHIHNAYDMFSSTKALSTISLLIYEVITYTVLQFSVIRSECSLASNPLIRCVNSVFIDVLNCTKTCIERGPLNHRYVLLRKEEIEVRWKFWTCWADIYGRQCVLYGCRLYTVSIRRCLALQNVII